MICLALRTNWYKMFQKINESVNYNFLQWIDYFLILSLCYYNFMYFPKVAFKLFCWEK